MLIYDDFGNPHNYREKWDPGSPEDYNEYWDMDDAFSVTPFYEIEPKDEETVTVKFFRGSQLTKEREVAKADLKHYEMCIGDSFYYREPGERYGL